MNADPEAQKDQSTKRNPYAPPMARLEMEQSPLLSTPNLRADLLIREEFGGFWVRVLAYMIDMVILLMPEELLIMPMELALEGAGPLSFLHSALLEYAAATVVGFFYFSLMNASRWQASVGKRICGLIVTSAELQRLTLRQSMFRYFAIVVCSFAIIDVFTIPFSERRRALHDMMAKTLVVKRRALLAQMSATA